MPGHGCPGQTHSWGSMLSQLRETFELLAGISGEGHVFSCTENSVNNFDIDLRFAIIYSELLFSLFRQEVVGVCTAEEIFPREENVDLESN